MLEKNPYKYNGESFVIEEDSKNTKTKNVYLESYGCAMNFSDSEIVMSILSEIGYQSTGNINNADLILINTCSIREKAELTVRKRLEKFNRIKRSNKNLKVGVLGCMAERLKHKFLDEEKIVDMVVGPDAYKDLPNLIEEINNGNDAVNVILSKDETYGNVNPVRINSNGVNAFVSITRGCDNMCTFCVVPFTRGRERSRDPQSIVNELDELANQGYREVTLLGQNVDSYLWYGGGLKKDFQKASEIKKASSINFSKLLEMCALSNPKMRIRFSTSNPQDMSIEVIKVMSNYENICNHIHLPVQSGSNKILNAMNRQHTRKEYLDLINKIYKIIPDCSISHDMITGFPNESEDDHKLTLSLMEEVKFSFGYMFKYSERPGTLAAKKLNDNVDEKIKSRRLNEIVELQQRHSLLRSKEKINQVVEVLIEKESKKSSNHWAGRNQQNSMVIIPKEEYSVGDFVNVKINHCTSATLIGEALGYSNNN